MQPLAISPLLLLLAGAVIALVTGIFLPRRRQVWIAVFAIAAMAVSALLAGWKLPAPPGWVFHRSFAVDLPFLTTWLVLMAAGAGCVLLSIPVFRRDAREAEYYVLMMFSLLGAGALAGAHDIMEIVLGVLLTAVPSYAMVAWRRADRLASEGLLKYYLLGALLNIGLVYGFVLIYGLSGSTILDELAPRPGTDVLFLVAIVLVLAGLGFKAGYVPAHFWIPDVYQATTIPVAAFLSVIPKIAAVLALTRLAVAFPAERFDMTPLIAIVAAVTMSWGNIAAFRQTDIRRLLGYSTIAQTGYLLIGAALAGEARLALPGLLYYFAAYAAANLGAFAVLGATGRYTIAEHRGLVRRHPWLAAAMLVALMSLMGLPPLAGFVGKLLLFIAAMDGAYIWLAVAGLINSVLSLFYYLRVLTPMFLDVPDRSPGAVEPVARGLAVMAAGLSLVLGLAAPLLLVQPVAMG